MTDKQKINDDVLEDVNGGVFGNTKPVASGLNYDKSKVNTTVINGVYDAKTDRSVMNLSEKGNNLYDKANDIQKKALNPGRRSNGTTIC